jgi:C4-dicarboxylate transporter DctM subunit
VTFILLGSFLLLLVLDVPVVFCMLIASTAGLLYAGVDPIMVGLEMSRTMAAFYPLIAVPFFILAGQIMNQGGLSDRIISFAMALVGHLRGGLAMVTTLSSMLFGAISGASSADTAAIGGVMIPAMRKKNYDVGFATALAACSGTTGALIPPSIVMIMYGAIAGLSIERLFLGGVIPGLLVGFGLMTLSFFYAKKHDVPVTERAGAGEILKTMGGSVGALLLVVIIFGGIFSGAFTATEASVVAVVYSLVVGLFIYRRLRLRDLPRIFTQSALTTARLTFLISAASLFAWVLTYGEVPVAITSFLVDGSAKIVSPLQGILSESGFFTAQKIVVLLVLNVSLLVIGMFVDAGPAIIILVPVLLPIADKLRMDPYHFGVMVVMNLVIGLVTPPVGTTLFVASGIAGIPMNKVVPHILRLVWVMVLALLVIVFFPPATTWPGGFMK